MFLIVLLSVVVLYFYLLIGIVILGSFRGNQERSRQLHQEDWLQPSCCCFRAHLWMERRQHVGSVRKNVLVQGMEC